MTLELKQYRSDFFNNSTQPYLLGGVKEITEKTEYGAGHFAITIFDRRFLYLPVLNMLKTLTTENILLKMESG